MTDLPKFSDWGNESSLLRIAENYIGLPIAFQGIHLRRDFANRKPVTTEFWHQDLEDRRMLKAILYLTDVDEEHGPFEYIPKSAISPLLAFRIRLQTLLKLLQARIFNTKDVIGLSDREIEKIVPRSKWKTCLGKAGTVVFVDPVAIFHHGKSRKLGLSTLFFVYTSQHPLRPDCCTQYSDQTFARPQSSVLAASQVQLQGGVL
ncbi:MAG: hypothetical protein ICV61_17765 [Microcoleus sp. Co-bin12]|nr:hypothetical protein [Microcoleus sp. Co-bin12]